MTRIPADSPTRAMLRRTMLRIHRPVLRFDIAWLCAYRALRWENLIPVAIRPMSVRLGAVVGGVENR